nr:MAG TPA: hypothetical protein [Caudoviricetes sp.]
MWQGQGKKSTKKSLRNYAGYNAQKQRFAHGSTQQKKRLNHGASGLTRMVFPKFFHKSVSVGKYRCEEASGN